MLSDLPQEQGSIAWTTLKALATADFFRPDCELGSLIMRRRPKRVTVLRITAHNGEQVWSAQVKQATDSPLEQSIIQRWRWWARAAENGSAKRHRVPAEGITSENMEREVRIENGANERNTPPPHLGAAGARMHFLQHHYIMTLLGTGGRGKWPLPETKKFIYGWIPQIWYAFVTS